MFLLFLFSQLELGVVHLGFVFVRLGASRAGGSSVSSPEGPLPFLDTEVLEGLVGCDESAGEVGVPCKHSSSDCAGEVGLESGLNDVHAHVYVIVVGEVTFLLDQVNEQSDAGGLDNLSVVQEGRGFLLLFRICKPLVEFRNERSPGG